VQRVYYAAEDYAGLWRRIGVPLSIQEGH